MSDQPIKNILHSWAAGGKNKEPYFQAVLLNKWEQITGKMIAQYTSKLYLKNNVLYLHISSAPLRKELSMGKAQIARIANECLGEEYIMEVQILG